MTTRAELSAAEGYRQGDSVLMRAALDGDTEQVKELLLQGADIDERDDNGRTALMFAVVNMHYETMEVLLEHGANVNAQSNEGGTPLIGAALVGDLRMVQALLDKGANSHVSLRGTNQTAASIAASHGYGDIARLLSQVK